MIWSSLLTQSQYPNQDHIGTHAGFKWANVSHDIFSSLCLQEKGFKYLLEVANLTSTEVSHLIHCAEYNIARAYFEGFGVKQSDTEAEAWLLRAAADGQPSGSIKAQTVLGLFYSRQGTDAFDLEKVGGCCLCLWLLSYTPSTPTKPVLLNTV